MMAIEKRPIVAGMREFFREMFTSDTHKLARDLEGNVDRLEKNVDALGGLVEGLRGVRRSRDEIKGKTRKRASNDRNSKSAS